MLARVFKIDVLKCDCCGGKLRPVCAVTEFDSIRRYLKAVEIDYEPPPRGPPRYLQESLDLEGGDQSPQIAGDEGAIGVGWAWASDFPD